ncbi:MAG: SDR family NAD(P)-dependent oxidoreductase [Hyphomonadaceae bacterium]|nr:SDR family NAD(P)-dependent oxidoreductase [Hyphomonadaceae bacterium]MBP9234114.1 SDR family NAD(P)-dependent oxidoreductase [Hyphomonadaceae bacterium]
MDRRIVLVTGASRGIGRAAALELAKAGNHVIATARSEKALTKLDDEIAAATGHNATLIPLDLRDGAAVDRLASALLERFGRLDGLMGNAGVLGTLGPLENISPAAFQETLDVNFTANWRLIRAVHPLLRMSEAGRALFVTSGIVPRPRAFWGVYGATKAALETMIACYADEIENTPIRVNLLDPGAVRTEMRFKAMPGEDPLTLPTPAEVATTIPQYLSPECTLHGERIVFAKRVKA